jgi:excinuclease ABC subunit A
MPRPPPNARTAFDQLRQRLAESFEAALRLAEGRAIALEMDSTEPAGAGSAAREHLFNAKFACPVCNHSISELEPRLFSFNSPVGACPSCDGLGTMDFFDPARVVAFPTLSLASGAIKGWDRRNGVLLCAAREPGETLRLRHRHRRSKSLPRPGAARHPARLGRGRDQVQLRDGLGRSPRARSSPSKHPFEGVIPNMARRYRETDSVVVREELARYRSSQPCTDCGGTRLRREARHVKVGDGAQARAIYEVSHATLREACDYFSDPEDVRGQGRDRRQGGARDRLAPEVPERRGLELPEPGPQRRDH